MMTNNRHEDGKMPTTAGLVSRTGLATLAGGIIFAGIQPIHTRDFLALRFFTSDRRGRCRNHGR